MKYGLTETQLKSILNTFKQYKEIGEVILFGSRSTNTYKPTSDIDIALKGNITLHTISNLQAQLEDLNIIFPFDVVNYHRISNPDFINHINQYGIRMYLKGWEETTLGEVCFFVNNKIAISEISLDNYISTENLLTNKLGVTTASSLPTIPKVNNYKEGDTLFSNIRTYFKKVWFANKNGGSSNDVLIFRPINEKQLYSKFLFYYISSDKFIDFTVKSAKGTKMPRGDKNAIINNSLSIPKNIEEQKAIAKILTAFDDKIENLQAQNKTLEITAQTIFKEWFGASASLSSQTETERSRSLPDGWRVFQLNEIVRTINGYSYKGKELVEESSDALVSLKSFDRNGGFQTRGFKPFKGSPKEFHEVKIGDLIVAHTDLTQDADVLGNPAFIFDNGGFEKMYITMDLVKIVSKNKDISLSFLYYLMKDRRFKGHCVGYSNGTTVLHLSKKAIPEYEVTLPKDFKKIIEFSKLADATTNKISLNKEQIQTLKKTRDTLLPKLMSGSLRVTDFKE